MKRFSVGKTAVRLLQAGLFLSAGSAYAIHPLNENPPELLVPVAGGAVIDNGLIKLGVNYEGHLNIPGVGIPSLYAGTPAVGLRLIYPTGGESESTAPGCLCEGWGASGDAVSGYANRDVGGVANLAPVSFVDTAATAVAVVDIDDGGGPVLRVTHDYHPSPDTPNLYEVTVTLTNVSGADIADLRYRRVMDWDIGPTTFTEYVTNQSGSASDLALVTTNGFDFPDPLSPPSPGGYIVGDVVDGGPTDHGAFFQFEFGALADGESKTFNIYYGAAFNEPDALAALAAVGAEAYSFGQPNVDPPADHGEPNTFIFGFSGVGGEPIFDELTKELTSGPDRDGSVWFEDFTDTSGLTLNGSAAAAGSALRLVPALTGQRGSAFTTNPLTLGPGASFSTEFSFQISSSGGGGADGLTFTLQNDPAGDMALGGGGGNIGYNGITNSLTVEFDSWNNGAGLGDPDANHVGTATNGIVGSGIAVPLPPPNLDTGTVFYAWIDYDGLADSLEVRISTSSTRPATPTLSQGGIGLAGLLGGTSAHAGFTSATGAAFGAHDVLSWHFASAIDLVVPINVEIPTAYDFTITYPGDAPVWIYDRVPAEWDVTHIEFDDTDLPLDCGGAASFSGDYGEVDISRGGKPGKKCNSDTGFRWMPGEDNTLNVQTLARCHNNRNNTFCRPTSCGALYLNYGAIALAKDPDTGELVLDDEGNPIVVDGPTDDICLAAVDDVNGDGTFAWDGSGDEDGDGLTDLEEACEIGTDPCIDDTDGDGVLDGADDCPLEGPPNPELGEILDPDGCIRQSQCSDGIDNDDDGVIDFAGGDLSCDDILDDSEDTPDINCPLVPGNTTNVCTLDGWSVRCLEWSGDTCMHMQQSVDSSTCNLYPLAGTWHDITPYNNGSMRTTKNFCAIATGDAAVVSEGSGGPATAPHSCGWSASTHPICESGRASYHAAGFGIDPNLGLLLQDSYCDADPNLLTVECAGW